MKKTITTYTLRLVAFLLLAFIPASFLSATTGYFFYVQFANKNNSPYSLSNPSAYLSQRAIDRRQTFGISIDSTDLPVNPAYISQIENLGMHVHCVSKWMNGATVLLADTTKMSLVRVLPFVTKVQYTGMRAAALPVSKKMKAETTSFNYGTAATQINQVNGAYLHNAGYTGRNIVVGVLDAGFYNANINPAFDSLRLQGRLLGTKDVAEPNSNVYTLDAHGANVLSIMTGNLPGQFLGVAPHASFWLIRTEYAPTEYLVENDFWASGIEFADSVGVDVVNSSLGYTEYDDPSMNFTYADMNGKVSRASRAANMASKKGIIVCNSAGNDGNKTWHYIGAPADADGILAIGAVTSTGVPSVFTSYGPSSDNRIKPDISAMGSLTAFVNINGVPSNGNGTSYSSPVMTGMIACLLQGYKERNAPHNVEAVRIALIHSGSLFNTPTAQLGYGIPDFEYALKFPMFDSLKKVEAANFELIYNAQERNIHILMFNRQDTTGKTVRLYSATGYLMATQQMTDAIMILSANNLSTGIYLVSISGNGKNETRKIIIH
ncbi:MAG: S8 family peptidase [Paludibacter sp.]|nr:S8 family peptidase [Paludibacter sp.]